MTYNSWSFKNSLYPVAKEQYHDEDGAVKYRIINPLTQEKLANVSEKYTLVHNTELVTPFVELFGEPKTKMLNGNRAHIFTFETGRDFDMGGGDIIKEQFFIRNSYNKSRSYEFSFGAFRLVCTNGLYTGVQVFNFKKIHIGDIPVQEMIHEVISRYKENSFELWKKMKDVPMSLTQQLDLVDQWTPFEFKRPEEQTWDTKTERINKYIKSTARRLLERTESLDNQRNGWGLFNQMNQATARELYSSAQAPRRMLGDKRAEEFITKELQLA